MDARRQTPRLPVPSRCFVWMSLCVASLCASVFAEMHHYLFRIQSSLLTFFSYNSGYAFSLFFFFNFPSTLLLISLLPELSGSRREACFPQLYRHTHRDTYTYIFSLSLRFMQQSSSSSASPGSSPPLRSFFPNKPSLLHFSSSLHHTLHAVAPSQRSASDATCDSQDADAPTQDDDHDESMSKCDPPCASHSRSLERPLLSLSGAAPQANDSPTALHHRRGDSGSNDSERRTDGQPLLVSGGCHTERVDAAVQPPVCGVRQSDEASPLPSAPCFALQSTEERLRSAQAAEVAVLQRLSALLASMTPSQAGASTWPQGAMGQHPRMKDNMIRGAGDASLTRTALRSSWDKGATQQEGGPDGTHLDSSPPVESTMDEEELYLPAFDGHDGRESSQLQGPPFRRLRVSSAGLTPAAQREYATLRRYLLGLADRTSPERAALSSSEVMNSATHAVVEASDACTSASDPLLPSEQHCCHDALLGTERRVGGVCVASSSPLLSPPRPEAEEDDDVAVLFPTPPRKTHRVEGTNALSHATPLDHLHGALPAHRYADDEGTHEGHDLVATSRLVSHGVSRGVEAGVPSAQLVVLGSGVSPAASQLCHDAPRVCSPRGESQRFAGASASAPTPSVPAAAATRVELTATDILATITALPPPPPKSVGSRQVKSSRRGPQSRTAGNRGKAAGGGQGKHDLGSVHEPADIAMISGESRRCSAGPFAPLAGLPCLGVDVVAAAQARWVPAAAGPQGSLRAEAIDGGEGQRERSPQPRGYVRTRPQRAVDVARTEAIFEAVRRAAGGGAQRPRSAALGASASPSASQDSSDSVQLTPAEYWEIDFP